MTTATPSRVAGLTGCLPPLPPAERLPVKYLHEYLTGGLGAPSYPVDVTGGIGRTDWGMLGNGPDPTCTSHPRGVGDCTFAGREHYHYAKAACYGLKGLPRETSNALVAAGHQFQQPARPDAGAIEEVEPAIEGRIGSLAIDQRR